ncbi:MAG: hypothetical protein K2L52_00690 [Clostridia bacterium]|nr:hypothetical protein [Clostridia bacterium]
MKKILIFLIAIILITTMMLTFAGCGESFSKNSIMSQINNNLGWHEGGTEVCTYDIFNKESVKLGEYTSTMTTVYNQNVSITTSNESVNPKLNNFTGYKFTSSMNAELDEETAKKVGYKTMEKITESYATNKLEPKLSYTKTVKDGKVEEIITSYETKKSNVTFIIDGATATDSAKYSASAFVVDNSFLYQFARATTLSSSVSIVVPTYSVDANQTKNASFTCSYASSSNVVLKNKFVLNKSFSETIASGEASGEINSGAINSGYIEASGDVTTSDADASGNVTVTYSKVLTSSIPVVRCSFTTTNTFPASGSISCMISTSQMKMQGDNNFVSRVVVRFVEGDITYDLTSVKFTR